MADLTARFRMIDEMSDKLSAVADSGQRMVQQFEAASNTASSAFSSIESSAASSVRSIDDVAGSISGNWTDAVGNYDKGLLEAINSTEELVEMGFKSADALAEEQEMYSLCEQSADALSKATDASAEAHSSLEEALSSASDTAKELADNENISAETKEKLSSATETAAEAMQELENAQNAAAEAAEHYDAVLTADNQSLEELESAAEQSMQAAERLAEANEQAANAADALTKANEEASKAADDLTKENEELGDSADDASKGLGDVGEHGVEAITSIASALAAAGITATVKEIAEAAYELADAFSEAESTVVDATGATGAALNGLMDSTMEVYSTARSGDLESISGAIGEINTRMGLTGDELSDVTTKFVDFSSVTNSNVVGSVQNVTKLMNQWNVEASEVTSVMDKLTYAGQISGASVDSLSQTLIAGAASFQNIGLSLDNTIQMLADFELAGINSTTAITAMRTAVNNFSKDGRDANTALQETIQQIATMEDQSAATALAVDTFGSRAGQQLALAIQNGTISLETFNATMDEAEGTLEKTAEASQTLSEKWDQATRSISAAFTSAIEPMLSTASSGLADIMNRIGEYLNEHPALVKAVTAIGAGLGVAAIAIAGVAAASLTAIPAVAAIGTAISSALGPIAAIAAGVAGLVLVFSNLTEESESTTDAMLRLNDEVTALDSNTDLITQYQTLSDELTNSSLSADELAAKQAELDSTTQALKDAYPELLGNIEAGTKAWDLQVQAIEASIEAERAAAMVEFNNNAEESIKELLELEAAYEDAEAAYQEAQDNMEQGLTLDVDSAISDVRTLKDELQEKIEAGEIYFDDQEYLDGVAEIDAALSELMGKEVHIEGLSDVDSYLQMISSGAIQTADDMSYMSQGVADAAQGVSDSYQALSASQQMFQSFLEDGMVTMDGLRTMSGNTELSLADLGLTTMDVGEKVATGMLTAEEASTRYGLSIDEVNRGVQSYYQTQEEAANATDEAATAAERSYREMLQLEYASQMVADGLMDAEHAAAAYGLSTDDLNSYMEEQNGKNDDLAAALALVEEGYMDAEQAAEAYNLTQQELEDYAVEEHINAVNDALLNLDSTYAEVYSAAYDSLSGQFDLWDKAEQVSATSMSDLSSNLQSQIDYWNEYNANLAALQNSGVDLSGIWDSLTDGSSEAVAAVAGMADSLSSGDTGALEEYVGKYSELQEAMGETATTITDGSGEVQEAMQGFWDAVGEGFDTAELREKAAQSGADTISGFLEGLDESSEVTTQLQAKGTEWIDALNASLGVHSPSTITEQSGVDTIQGYVNGVDGSAPEAVTALTTAAELSITAFESLMNGDTFYTAGVNAIQGAINGINAMLPSLIATATSAGEQAAAAYKAAQDINSPSKLFEWFSEMDIAGAIQGFENNQEELNQTFAAAGTESAEAYQEAFIAPDAAAPPFMEEWPLQIDLPEQGDEPKAAGSGFGTSEEKTIHLEINGTGTIDVGPGTSKDEVLEIMIENLRPVLLSVISTEVMEEGDDSYDY